MIHDMEYDEDGGFRPAPGDFTFEIGYDFYLVGYVMNPKEEYFDGEDVLMTFAHTPTTILWGINTAQFYEGKKHSTPDFYSLFLKLKEIR